ncbi:MAG: AAA family ATPase, partial [Candidatus Diapherotrites archaeon]|nr:AAA family ATPase [Candidatus Diapherotrites archaeon]
MSDSFLWTDKYAPTDLMEFVGNSNVVHELKLWANQWASGKRPKPILLVGGQGVGKTTLGHLLGKFMQWQVLETNCSDTRNKAGIERVVGAAHGVSSLSGGQRLLLIDEVDGLSSRDRGGAVALGKIMKDPLTPMVLTANDQYAKSLKSLVGLAKVVKLKKINYLSIAKRLRAVCVKEEVNCDNEALVSLAKSSGG